MALTKCSSCGNDVSTDAAACPKCGKPMKKGLSFVRLVLYAIGGLFLLCVIGGLFGGKSANSNSGTARPAATPASTPSAATAPTPTPSADPAPAAKTNELLPWVETVEANCAAYKAAPNQIKKSEVFNRNTALIGKTKVSNVKGELTSLTTTQGGDELSLRVKVGEVEFHTESLFGPIKKGSAVYKAATDLSEGQCVVFSASSLKASSLMEESMVCDPEYFAVFTSIAPCK